MQESIDYYYQNFLKILDEIYLYKDTILSEEDTRVKVIDRILEKALGYDLKDVYTEPSSGDGFIDYLIKQKEIARLVIEAKKEGLDFQIDTSYTGRAFILDGSVFGSKIVKDGLNQTIYYAAQESVELGCLTNGNTWIIFRANRLGDGKKPIKGKGFVFGSLEGIKKEFKLFYELLAPKNVVEYKYRAIFQEVEGSEIRARENIQSLKNEDNIRLADKRDHSDDFERVMKTFFSKLSGDNDPEMLAECFVETKESQAAEYQLTRISQDLIHKIKTIETVEGEAIQIVIERIKATNRQEFIILVGGKGAGKSTFVDRFFNYILSSNLKDDCVIVRINLGRYKGSDLDIVKWLDMNVLEECERTLYDGPPSYEEIQGTFFSEYQRLRVGNWRDTYNNDKNQFKIDFGKHIESIRGQHPTEYIQKLIGNVVKSRKRIPCIVFDNADHFSIDIQDKVFQYARAIYESEICLVICPITDKTSWQLSKQGAIRSYENEVFFLPTPPPKKIIEKRIEYLDKKIDSERKIRGHYFLSKGISITIGNIEGFVRFLQLIFLKDERILRWIGSFSNYDIRLCLEITKDLISSPHLSIDEFLKAYATEKAFVPDDFYSIKPYRIKNALVKRDYESYPIGHHPFIHNLFYCLGDVNTTPLLALRVLQVLNDKKTDRTVSDSFLSVNQILDYFNAMGVERSRVHKHLQFLLTKGLISSYDPSVVDLDFSKSVEITPSGTLHYFWGLNEIDYAFTMLEITPIADKHVFSKISDNYYAYHQKLYTTLIFLNYLEDEDRKYCKIPDHVSYIGQNVIFQRFDWQRKIINRKTIKL